MNRPATSSAPTVGGLPPVSRGIDPNGIPLNRFQAYGPQIVKFLRSMTPRMEQGIRFYQRDAVLRTIEKLSYNEKNRLMRPVLVCAPPGAGKSGIITLLPYALQSTKAMILTPSIILSNQLAQDFGHFENKKSFLEVAGVCADAKKVDYMLEAVTLVEGKFNPQVRTAALTIINAQKFGGKSGTTLSLEYGKADVLKDVRAFFQKLDLLIVDEAHHYPAKTWDLIVTTFYNNYCPEDRRKRIVFFSATDKRGDGSYILPYGQESIAYSIGLNELEGSTIRKLEFIQMEEPLRDSKFRFAATFATISKDIKTQLEKQHLAEPGFLPQAMVMVFRKSDAIRVANKLNELNPMEEGEFAVAILGDQWTERNTEDFSAGLYRVAVICNVLKEGYSNTKVTLCVILRNISSRVLFDQFVGRCTRFHERGNRGLGQSNGIILSYPDFGQEKMWKGRQSLAEVDPTDEELEQVVKKKAPKRKRSFVGEGERRSARIQGQQSLFENGSYDDQ